MEHLFLPLKSVKSSEYDPLDRLSNLCEKTYENGHASRCSVNIYNQYFESLGQYVHVSKVCFINYFLHV